ncbi:SDR family NAD(P)-dependent oxidoreductase [Algiphilus sp. W345]|uniref:SDR family NAD(P)-dependent oxidoreductase n=1 Tax=Banduia mediterranea TaxID=3075609 RepID=A0ABU2WJL0_9GAMM|nr:SDR family NAD(P)-dependent oxidoreductase [Algiphilus sp. W345]MDT0498068.1 SDR family NAD(P)-dependent oxidoreductase [Algiphilus sp. W345]
MHGTKACLPRRLERDRGVIVNASSVFGFVAWPMHSAYAASKFAVRGYTETLRHQLAGSADRERIVQEFDPTAMTSPDKAAATIIDGIARGKRRILISLDARIMERLTRWLPTRYWGVIAAANSYRKPSAAEKNDPPKRLRRNAPPDGLAQATAEPP